MKPPVITRPLPKKTEMQGQKRYLFYSAMEARILGMKTASIRVNKKGDREEISFTSASSEPKAPECGWPDRKLVWSGDAADLEILIGKKPGLPPRKVFHPATHP